MTICLFDASHKPCIACRESKPLSEFYAHARMGDGHLNKCKACCKAAVRANYVAKRAQYQMYELLRSHRPERKEQAAEAQRRRRATHPDKARAWRAVSYAIRAGHLKRQPCKCGATKVQAHHHDYSKPLDVEWLCFGCHRREHGQNPFF